MAHTFLRFSQRQEATTSRAFTWLVLPLVLLIAACGDSATPVALQSDEVAVVAQATIATNPTGQEQHIEALVNALEAAWAAKDAAAYAAPYAQDVEFIGPTAAVLSGREALRLQHAFLFGPGPFRQSTQTIEIRRIEFLTGTIAIVDQNVTLTGYLGLPPGLRETEPGTVRNLVRWVVVKERGEWLIRSHQMTPLPPVA